MRKRSESIISSSSVVMWCQADVEWQLLGTAASIDGILGGWKACAVSRGGGEELQLHSQVLLHLEGEEEDPL